MDTTKKGNKLEEKVFEYFKEEISKGRFFAKKEHCRVHPKKGYYSKDRNKNIIFDMSIELFLPGQKTYSMLILIECKNYNHKVPVDDLEEFFAKTQQISGANVKGIVVSTNAFQEGAFNFAKSKGIGFLRYFDRNQLDWVLTRSPSSMVSSAYSIEEYYTAYKGLHSQSFKSNYFDCYGYVAARHTNSLHLFISILIKNGSDKKLNESLAAIETVDSGMSQIVPYIEQPIIEKRCVSVLKKIGHSEGSVSLEDVCNWLKEQDGLKVSTNSSFEQGVLGKITFNPLEIYIDNRQCETQPRKRFTLAHELGHLLLKHSEYMIGELCHESDVNMENPANIGIKDIKRMEWQANQFASCLLLPKEEFVQAFLKEAARNELYNKGFGVLYLDDQPCNLNSYHKVTNPLMRRFAVSRSTVKIRLKKLGFLNEVGKLNESDIFCFKRLDEPFK